MTNRREILFGNGKNEATPGRDGMRDDISDDMRTALSVSGIDSKR